MRWLAVALVVAACSSSKKRRETPATPPPTGSATGKPTAAADRTAAFEYAEVLDPDNWDSSRAKITAERDGAPPEDKPLYDQMLAMMREEQGMATDKAHEHDHLVEVSRLRIDILHGLAERATDDVQTQRMVVDRLTTLALHFQALQLDDRIDLVALRRDARDRGHALVKRFPDDAESWRLLGVAELRADSEHGTSLAAMRAYQTCTKLSPATDDCTHRLAELRAIYVAPYCEGAAMNRGFGWYEGGDSKSKHVPKFTSADVQRMRAGFTDIGNTLDVPAVILELRPSAGKPMARWIEDLQNRGHFMVLQLGARELVNTKDTFVPNLEHAEVPVTGLSLGDVCTTTSTQTLPADLL